MWTVAAFGLRVFNRAHKEVFKGGKSEKEYIPSAIPGNSPAPGYEGSTSYFPGSRAMSRAASYASGRGASSDGLGDWRGR